MDIFLTFDPIPGRNELNHMTEAFLALGSTFTMLWHRPGAIVGQRRGLARFALACLASLLVAAGSFAARPAWADAAPVTVLAAGDIAFCERPWSRIIRDWFRGYDGTPGAPETAALLDDMSGTVLVLGDLAYFGGTAEQFADCYDPSWGRHKDRSYPAPGNHDYDTPGGPAYFDYWGKRAGEPGKGYYSFDLGAWHIVALNSNIPLGQGSEQDVWLRRDLAESEAACILAFMHHPPFSSGAHGDQSEVRDAMRALYEAGASVVLSGHDHNYERFAPMDPDGRADAQHGLRSFVVGTGGGQLRPQKIRQPPRENSEVVDGTTWGLLELTLGEKSYSWRFVPVEGQSFEDSGQAPCVERKPAN